MYCFTFSGPFWSHDYKQLLEVCALGKYKNARLVPAHDPLLRLAPVSGVLKRADISCTHTLCQPLH